MWLVAANADYAPLLIQDGMEFQGIVNLTFVVTFVSIRQG